MGTVASGQLQVKSEAATGTLPFGACAVPIVRGGLLEEATLFVSKNPATKDGSWPVTQAGTLVSVEALQGGPVGNSKPGTQYRWDLPVMGIEEKSTTLAGLSGGVASVAFGAVRQLISYKKLDQPTFEQFLRAQMSQYPAICLCWESTGPLDGPMAAQGVPRLARMGSGKFLFRHTWALFIVTARLDTQGQRQREGDTVRDDVLETLFDTMGARGLRVANEPGAEILDARVFGVTPTSYVDLVRIGCTVTLQHRRQRTEYNDWLRTRLQNLTQPNGEGPAISPPIKLPDVTDPMPPNGSA
jgi:hypothetical protein